MKLRIANNLALPVETVTQAIGILAKRRAGKSYAARRLTEQLFHAGLQVVIVDPKGDWWGIRSAADGQAPGLPVVILGGEHGDVKQLEANGGEVVAKLVVEERLSVLLDLSLFRKHEVATFMTGFLETIYRLKAREVYRTPMMLMVDEADAIAPQKPMKGEERMLGAAEDIVRRGGQRGIGCTLVTQRSAVLNKNLLTQVQVLIALRTIAPQDLEALNAWIDVHGTPDQQKTLMASLPALPVGDAWVWSPGWPTVTGIFEHVHVLPIETFDSGSTPTARERRVEPKHLADVDLEALQRQMAATIERAKAEDPRELRRQLAAAQQAVTAAQKEMARLKAQPDAPAPAERVTVPVITADEWKRIDAIRDAVLQATKSYEEHVQNALTAARSALASEIVGLTSLLSGKIRTVAQASPDYPKPGHLERNAQRSITSPQGGDRPVSMARREPNRPASNDGIVLGKGGDARMLVALAQHADGLTASQLSILIGIAKRGGTFRTYLGKLKTAGWVQADGGRLVITDEGLGMLGDYEPLPTGRALIAWWQQELGNSGLRSMFDAVVDVYPRTLTLENLSERTNIAREGGTFRTYLGKLKTLELVEGRSEIRASDTLFG
jgi:hypothetical protein